MRGVNDTADDLLDLCFALQGEAAILPYYFYMCDMVPSAEHWRTPAVASAAVAVVDHGLSAGFRDTANRLRCAVCR